LHIVKKTSSGPTPAIIGKSSDAPSFIDGWFLQDLSICDDLIKYHAKNQQFEGKVGGSFGNLIVDKSQKDSFDTPAIYSDKNTEIKRYDAELQAILDCYLKKYSYADDVCRFMIESWNIQKYFHGGGFHSWHTERNNLKTSLRHLAFMTYLNDVTDEGETEFFYQELKIKPQKGLTLIWPCDWTHTHRGIPSTTEIKYIATGWYQFVGV
tara:strand:+ start:559 stop:1185 length:627 start_codon:yes stop_codon:yes gene_type:complete